MKNTWLIWLFGAGAIITVFVAFNYEGGKQSTPLSEIFPDEEAYPIDIQYEFVEDEIKETATEVQVTKVSPETVTEEKIAAVDTSLGKESQPVNTEILDKVSKSVAEKISSTDAVAVDNASFTIQVASFKKRESAQAFLDKLKKKEYSAYIVARDLGEKGTWYRVYIGQYASKQDATSSLTKIKSEYKNSFIISPKKN